MRVNFRISNMHISLWKSVDKTIEKEFVDIIGRKIKEVTMISIMLTRSTKISMMINHSLRKVRRRRPMILRKMLKGLKVQLIN